MANSMEDYGALYDNPDLMRTMQRPVYLCYEHDGDDSPERYFPFTRRAKDAEPKRSAEQELRLMEQQVEESKGFDIDFSQFSCLFNYQPVPFEIEHEFLADETTSDFMDRLSRESLDGFNEKHNTRYEFVKVIKANYHQQAGIMFYITFEARLQSDNADAKQFQTRVWYCCGSDVISCELKQQPKKVHSIEAPEKEDPKKPRLTEEQSEEPSNV